MTRPALRVDGLGKRYQLGLTHAGSLSGTVSRWTRRLRGLPPEEAKVDVGPTTLRESKPAAGGHVENGASDFWALKDVSFEVRPGEVVGVIGRNGAGKSTLLKLLSRVTAPTTGVIEVEGRVGSLLEVGTGFHPELTGRENVFMNATLLGMSKREVSGKLDEIVDFSGVEKFLDTPVKRYSSGMKVRLGFAVAAHLEPEVLIVDEVLAVGDADFQQKCLGKMKAVAGEGRTVLFVSHNLNAVRNLCSRGLVLGGGELLTDCPTAEAVRFYMSNGTRQDGSLYLASEPHGDRLVSFRRIGIGPSTGPRAEWGLGGRDEPEAPVEEIDTSDGISVRIELEAARSERGYVCFYLTNEEGVRVLFTDSREAADPDGAGSLEGRSSVRELALPAGLTRLEASIPGQLLSPGQYTVTAGVSSSRGEMLDHVADCCRLTLRDLASVRERRPGVLSVPIPWKRLPARPAAVPKDDGRVAPAASPERQRSPSHLDLAATP